jgi:hypothetical protein
LKMTTESRLIVRLKMLYDRWKDCKGRFGPLSIALNVAEPDLYMLPPAEVRFGLIEFTVVAPQYSAGSPEDYRVRRAARASPSQPSC